MNSVIPYEGINLATISAQELRDYVDGWVRKLATSAGRANRIMSEWKRNGTPTMMTADQVVEAKKKNLEEIKKFDDYREEQSELFASKGLPRHYADTKMIVATGETARSGLPMCRILDRGVELREIDEEDGEHALSIAGAKMFDERTGINKLRGKYNDEGRLFDADSASIKVGEVEAWASI